MITSVWKELASKCLHLPQEGVFFYFILCGRSAAIVDESRLNWINFVHTQRLFKDQDRMEDFVNDLRSNLLSWKEFGLEQIK